MHLVRWTPALAQDQAELFNRSDPGWPSTITHGLPFTAKDVRITEARARTLDAWMAYEGRRPVGFVRLTEMWGDNEAAYVSFLNVEPGARGKGVGKALIFRCLQESIARGYPRLDLHTWPGNDRAMRLYKRTGFQWVPETNTYMQNFLPQILLFPPAKTFFARHDWYRTYRRKITYDEDKETEGKAKVFAYRFRGRNDSLTVWIDPRSKSITGYETPQVRVFARPEGPVVAGSRRKFLWDVRNPRDEPVRIALAAKSSGGFTVSEVRPRNLPPRKTVVLTAMVEAPRDLWPKGEEEKPHRVETQITIGATTGLLGTALEASRPISVSTVGPPAILAEGARDLTLLFRAGANGYRGTLHLVSEDLEISPARVSLRLKKGKEKVLAVKINSRVPGPRFTMLRVTSRNGTEDTLPLPVLERGQSAAVLDRDRVRIRSQAASVELPLHGGAASVHDARHDPVADWIHLRVGPGLWPSEVNALDWRAEVDPRGGATLRTVPPKRPWLEVAMEVRVRHDLVDFRCSLKNASRQEQVLPVNLVFFPGTRWEMTLATREGVRRTRVSEWEIPVGRGDLPEDCLTEGWVHFAGRRPSAVIWDERVFRRAELIWWSLPSLLADVTVPAGGQVTLPAISLVVGCASWPEARALWAQRRGSPVRGDPAKDLRGLEADPPAALTLPGSRLALRFRNSRRVPEDGTVSMELPQGFVPRSLSLRTGRVDLRRPWERAVRFQAVPRTPGVHTANAVFSGTHRDWGAEIPLLVPRGRITAHGGRLLAVESPSVRLQIARNSASVVSLRWRGREYLRSSYPEETAWAWFRPWCGGVGPSWNDTLGRKGLFGRNRVRQSSGKAWASVGFSPKEKPKGAAGLDVECEYTAFAGLPVVALSYRLRNSGRERKRVDLGFTAFPQWLEEPAELRFGERLSTRLKAGAITSYDEACGPIVASSHPRGVLALVAGPGGQTEAADLGADGRFITARFQVDLERRESRCLTAYLIAARTLAQAWAHESLHVATADDLRRAPSR